MKILVAANSPGEVAWVRPLARVAQERGHRLDVILYPCTFATGNEAEVLQSYPAVERVWQKGGLWSLFWRRHYQPLTPLLHLGGDLMYTAILHWRWGFRCFSYLWARPWWDRAYAGYFSRNHQTTQGILRRRVAPAKVVEVGDLVVDAVTDSVPELPEKDPNLITFLPGSREDEISHALPLMGRAAEILLETRPRLRFQVMLSPFLKLTRVAELVKGPLDPRMDGTPARLEGESFVFPSGLVLPVIQRDPLPHTAKSSLAVSLPGTKTAEAACLGVPCLTLVPLNCPEVLPIGGLLGWLDWVPGGGRLKGALLLKQRHKVGLLAQPNQLLGEKLMPEIVDHVDGPSVAEAIGRLLDSPAELHEKGLRLRQAYLGLAGASQRMLDNLL